MVPLDLLTTILEQYALPWNGVHGVSHWARVLENGRRMAAASGANLEVVELFAILHDSRRRNEGVDFIHGPQGARYARELNGSLFHLSEPDMALLFIACDQHTNGHTNADVTVQVCWDSDRLDLGRVGIVPKPSRLCTPAARDPEMLAWADQRAHQRLTPDLVLSEWGIDLSNPGMHHAGSKPS
jgi:uncharacterized protein